MFEILQSKTDFSELPCFEKPDPGDIFVRRGIRRYSMAEIEEAIEVEGGPERGAPRRYRMAEIERGEAGAIQETINGETRS